LIYCGIGGVRRGGNVYNRSFLPLETDVSIELNKGAHDDAVNSIVRYFRENMDEPIGNLQAGALLAFMLEEIGPSIYNKAVSDAQNRLQARVMELDFEVHEEEFQYWSKHDKRKGRRK